MRVGVINLLLLGLLLPLPARAAERIAIIIHVSAVPPPCSKAELARIYLRKRSLWPDGTRITPVNLPADHSLRRTFSQIVLDALPEDLETYWNDRYFHGVAPPHVLTSEEAVIRFVTSTPGAIGYVTESAVTKDVQVILSFSPDGEKDKSSGQ